MAPQPESPTARIPASRKLEGLELAMRITDEETPFSVVSVLQIKGDLSAATLRSALDLLQQRHALLRARIVPAGKEYEFRFDGTGPIPLEVGDRQGPDSWRAVVEEELRRPFDHATGPLIRCRYLAGPGAGDVIVTIPHAIVDAASAQSLFVELLGLCAGRTPEDPPDAQEGQVSPGAVFPEEYTGLGYARAVAGYMAHQGADEMQFRWHSRGVRKPPIAESGNCRILPIRFDATLTAALVRASRREKVTLTAMLSAAMLAAVHRRLYPGPPRAPLRTIIFADMRGRLRRAVPENVLGCFLTMFRLTVMVDRDGPFWALARQIQDLTGRAAASGERYLAYAMSPGMMKMIFRLKAFRMGVTALSYSGPLNLPSFGSFEVTGVHAFAANMPVGPEFSALCRLFRGELCADALYLDCDMDAAGAHAIADDMRAILEGATC